MPANVDHHSGRRSKICVLAARSLVLAESGRLCEAADFQQLVSGVEIVNVYANGSQVAGKVVGRRGNNVNMEILVFTAVPLSLHAYRRERKFLVARFAVRAHKAECLNMAITASGSLVITCGLKPVIFIKVPLF